MLEQVVTLSGTDHVTEQMMLAFWPGPLTLLLPRAPQLPEAVTAGRTLVGVRIPQHPVARELIHLAGVPVAAPSANRFGHTSPTTAAHVLQDLDGRIDAVLDGGAATVGVESTVFDVAARIIYRPGAVTAEHIAEAIGEPVHMASSTTQEKPPEESPSPGMGQRHYAPNARLVLVDSRKAFQDEIVKYPATSLGVMLPDGWDPGGAVEAFRWGPWDRPDTLARLLYLGLRMLDQRQVKVIICPVPQTPGIGEALRDRLTRAAK
jgi:L-threonylcarbamoyladenylate synthase